MSRFRMLETWEYGGFVPMPVEEDPALDDARVRLLDELHLYEEENVCASWTSETPWWVWRCIHTPKAEDGEVVWRWSIGNPSDEERAATRALAEEAGGWWVWLDEMWTHRPMACPCEECKGELGTTHSGFIFVPMALWREAVAMGDRSIAEWMIKERLGR